MCDLDEDSEIEGKLEKRTKAGITPATSICDQIKKVLGPWKENMFLILQVYFVLFGVLSQWRLQKWLLVRRMAMVPPAPKWVDWEMHKGEQVRIRQVQSGLRTRETPVSSSNGVYPLSFPNSFKRVSVVNHWTSLLIGQCIQMAFDMQLISVDTLVFIVVTNFSMILKTEIKMKVVLFLHDFLY